jgi:hypothetical protein
VKYEVGVHVMRETENKAFFAVKICSSAVRRKQQRYFVLPCLVMLRSNPNELKNLNDDALIANLRCNYSLCNGKVEK